MRGRSRRRSPLKVWDAVILAVVVGLCAVLSWRVYAQADRPVAVHIHAADGESYYPLDRDREIDVPGPLGVSRIVIEHGSVRFVDSPCPNKTCVHSGAVSRAGSGVACLPNGVMVTIEGRLEEPYDAESH
jgi:hypothetical protein